MTTEAARPVNPARSRPVAPWRHTAVLAAVFLVAAAAGAWFQHAGTSPPVAPAPRPRLLPLYLSLLLMEWGLLLYVTRAGLRRTGTRLGELVGGRWRSAGDLLRDLATAGAAWAVWKGILLVWARALGPGHAASISQLLPRGPIEVTAWIALSISAGICEEIAFRGYFQRQFEALTGSRWIAWALQAALFGVAHGYQGAMACFKIAAFGGLFGLIALWRRSLVPGILAHALTDVLAGCFGV